MKNNYSNDYLYQIEEAIMKIYQYNKINLF